MSKAGPPLVVDLDHSFLRTDTLLEAVCQGMGRDPIGTLRRIVTHWRDRPALKAAFFEAEPTDPSRLPIRTEVAALVAEARSAGRPVVLASGADQRVVEAVAQAHGPFDAALGSGEGRNLTGTRKAAALVERFGEGGFDYIGDSRADMPVWQAARAGFVVGAGPRRLARFRARVPGLTPLGAPWQWRALLQALRPHQWVKNVLLFLPIIAAHDVGLDKILAVLAGMAVFSAAASSIYIVNDLVDIAADRQHETKRARPFAAGTLPIEVGLAGAATLGLGALIGAAAMGPGMVALIVVYLATTLAYSVQFKRKRWVDIATLAVLYTLRVVAGAVAAGVAASGWLIAFVFPVFLTLACVKRLTELARAKTDARLPGRAYAPADRDDVLNVALISAVSAVFVFLLYSYGDVAARLYGNLWLLRAVSLTIALWLWRMVMTGVRGRQSYDPIVFALRDPLGLILVAATVAGLFLAEAPA